MSSITTSQLAEAIGVSKATLAKMIGDGRLPAADIPSPRVGVEREWSADHIAPYLPGGAKAATKRKPGRKPA